MAKDSSKGSRKGGGGGTKAPKDPALAKVTHEAAGLYGTRAEDIKAGDTISDSVFDQNGNGRNRAVWTFHPEGYETFKSQPYSDLEVTEVKVTNKTVKVTALYDKANTKRNPQKSDWGKDFIKVTKTFKRGDVTQKRVKQSG